MNKNCKFKRKNIMVIKQNIVDNEDLQRRTPMHNFAFKPSPSIRITKVKNII